MPGVFVSSFVSLFFIDDDPMTYRTFLCQTHETSNSEGDGRHIAFRSSDDN
jgi:hypothetical protein